MSTIQNLRTLVGELAQERQVHADAIAEIDAAFDNMGLNQALSVRPRRRPRRSRKGKSTTGPGGKVRRKRRKFAVTGNDLVLRTIKNAGAKGATGSQVATAWKRGDRAGSAYNILTTLVKEKKVRREKSAGVRGSRYFVA